MVWLQLLLIILIVFKIYLKLTTGWCRNKVCLMDKTAIITGANTGIGYETALEFAKRGCRIILACRNLDKAESAKKRIIEQTSNPNIIVKLLNLSSLESIRAFARDINATEERLDILINNAGIGITKDCRTIDDLQGITQVNYFGPFLLTLLLLKKLQKSPNSRIVNVSSALSKFADFKNIDNLNTYHGTKSYHNTKLFNILFTKELAKKLENTGTTTYSLHPGVIKTEIFRHFKGVNKIIVNFILNTFSKTPEEGAQTTIHLATEPNIEQYSGEHFEDCQHVETYKTATDANLAKLLWQKTEELVKLKPEENPFLF